ncbi:SubName: Full=Uncharacterized protein {ECO:0000313/EMBL:CCA67421.1} [Serendipita indica DSM 11827]|nr:SubName: Full=Uncharacterized protein {ECO:0000313/EMBL:CCA67421.1} [Serendipita indica DSM 11827]
MSICPRWIYNSNMQTPCDLWSALGAKCSPSFTPPTSPFDFQHFRPTDDACQCNMVAYNLMGGCAVCEECRVVIPGEWPTIAQWKESCKTTVFNNTLSESLSNGLLLPPWALQAPNGTTWQRAEASVNAARASSTATSSWTGFGSIGSSSSTNRHSDTLGMSIAIGWFTFIILLIVAKVICWCSVICFLVRQKRRVPAYRKMAAYYRANGAGTQVYLH